MKYLFFSFFYFVSLSIFGQFNFIAEGRFCGIGRGNSVVFEANSPHFEIWTRFENYHAVVNPADDVQITESAFGYTSVFGFGLPQIKIIAGLDEGEFIKGIQWRGQNESATFKTNLIVFHKRSLVNAFSMDGELEFEKYSNPASITSESRPVKISWGGFFRIECYEPVPMACYSGLALRRTRAQKAYANAGKKPGGDFLDSFDPGFMNQFKGVNYATDWTLFAGPTYYFDGSTGAHVALRCDF